MDKGNLFKQKDIYKPRPTFAGLYMRFFRLILTVVFLAGCLTSCELPGADTATQEEVVLASAKLKEFLQGYDERLLALNPDLATFSGSRVGWDRLSSGHDSRHQENQGLLTAWMERMTREVDTSKLDPSATFHYHLFRAYAEQQQQDYRWRKYNFPSDPSDGPGLNALLTYAHPLETPADAEAYVKRLEALPVVLRQWQARLAESERDSLLPIRSVLADVRRKAVQPAGLVTADSHLVADPTHPWLQRINAWTDAHPEAGAGGSNLRRRAWEAYSYECIPEYNRILQWFYQKEAKADTFQVVTDLPSGVQWYNYLLSHYAGVPTTADDAYTLGLHEVDRLEMEVRDLITAEKFPGGVVKFLDSLRQSQELYLFSPGPAGKVEFIQRVSRMQDSLNRAASHFADLMPAYRVVFTPIEVPAKETDVPFTWEEDRREPFATLTMNLGCRSQLESWRWPAQLAENGIPGRLLPVAYHDAIRDSFLIFRRQMEAPWYFEGWSLYSVNLPIRDSLFLDSASVRSALLCELIHAVTLVVDAGLHSNHWTLPQAELYLKEKTPLSATEIKTVITKVLMHPGASVAPVAGAKRIQEWKTRASGASLQRFSPSAFHFLLLRKGPLPVQVMEREIRIWIAPSATDTKGS